MKLLLVFLAGVAGGVLVQRWRAWERGDDRGVDLEPVQRWRLSPDHYWHLVADPPDPRPVELMDQARLPRIGGVG